MDVYHKLPSGVSLSVVQIKHLTLVMHASLSSLHFGAFSPQKLSYA